MIERMEQNVLRGEYPPLHLPARPTTATGGSSCIATASCGGDDLQMMSRSVPEMDLAGSHHMPMHHGQCLGVGGCSVSTLEFQRQTLGTSHNPYLDPSVQESLFDGNGCGYVKEEEAQLVHIQEPVGACNSVIHDAPTNEILYGFEDGLRHKINVQIEDFRFSIQQTLTEEFHDYSSSVIQPPVAKCRRCDSVTDSLGSHHPQPRLEEEASCQSSHGGGSSSVAGGGEGMGVVDSGACSTEGSRENTTLDKLIDQQLIQLQTHAALITSTLLSRSEYSVGHEDHDTTENKESALALSDSD